MEVIARVYVGLGSNINAEENLKLGVSELRRRFGDLDISSVYRNAAVGFVGADFLNLVIGLNCEDTPAEFHQQIEAIHKLAGRELNVAKVSSRPLDIDLLLYGDLVISERSIRVPRSDILKYGFVLRPLAELAPHLIHPETGQSLEAHWQIFDREHHPLIPVSIDL